MLPFLRKRSYAVVRRTSFFFSQHTMDTIQLSKPGWASLPNGKRRRFEKSGIYTYTVPVGDQGGYQTIPFEVLVVTNTINNKGRTTARAIYNRFGHLEIWQGFASKKKTADVCIESDYDIKRFMEELPEDKRQALQSGISVHCFVNPKWFKSKKANPKLGRSGNHRPGMASEEKLELIGE